MIRSALAAGVVVLVVACGAPAKEAPTQSSPAGKPGQWIELPFSVGKTATGIAITNAGDVYVADVGRVYERTRAGFQASGSLPTEDLGRETGRVLRLEKGAANPTVALDGVDTMGGIAVGADGAIYVATRKPEVKRFQNGASSDLPFKLDAATGPTRPQVNVDDAGRVYAINEDLGGQALKLDRGATEPTEVPVFLGTGSDFQLAVTGSGDVYGLADAFDGRELRTLAAGAGEPRGVQLVDVKTPLVMAVHNGDVYVLDDTGQGVAQDDYATENLRIVKFDKGAIDAKAVIAKPLENLPKVTSSAVIPFTPQKKGAYHDMEIAPNGDIYLIDGAKVLKLTPA